MRSSISEMMSWLYTAISQIMLFWHGIWDRVLPDRAILGTNWQWLLAVVFLVVTVRAVLFPIFVKQIKSQRSMQALQPKMKELQEKYKNDREAMQKELMELYRKEKVNPMMGCLPMFIQIPVFLSLFHVLKWIRPFDKPMLYGWKLDLYRSAAEARLFGAPFPAKFSSTASELAEVSANGTNVKIVAGVLVLIMMGTTFLTSRQMILKTGWAEDPQQRMMQRLMLYGIPFSLLVSGWMFPLGVIIYWVTNNLISLGQQAWVLHKYPPPAIVTKKPSTGGGSGSATGKSLTGRAVNGKAVAGRTVAGKPGPNRGRTSLTKAADGAATEVGKGKAVAPRPGVKPVNPKKGGQNKRTLG